MARSCRERDALDATERLENWRRWGSGDQIGALHLICAPPLNVTGGTGSLSNLLALE
jgi:hypothetical protein